MSGVGAYDRPKLDWFRVRDEAALERLKPWIMRQTRVNTFNPKQDRKGDWIILIGWDDRPDSDWGRFKGHSCAVWFASYELLQAGEDVIREAWGWQPREGVSA